MTQYVIAATKRSHDPEVHRAGCADVKRGLTSGKYEFSYDFAGDSPEDAAADFWSDFIAEESMTVEDALTYTKILPCVKAAS